MSKITNDSLTRPGTGCFIAVAVWQQWASKMMTASDRVDSEARWSLSDTDTCTSGGKTVHDTWHRWCTGYCSTAVLQYSKYV